jgi:anti-sigma factor (TIGR02949 family)
MSACESFRRLLAVYLDGELEGDERSEFESHAHRCEDCRRVLEAERAQADAVARAHPRRQAPEALRQRVSAIVAAAPPRARRRWGLLAVAGAAVGVALTGAWLWRGRAPHPMTAAAPSDFAALAADSHLRHLHGQLPLEVASARPDEVARWFSGRLPFHLTLPDYPVGPGQKKFYRLLGGRLIVFRGDYAAFVAYRLDDQRPISLLVTSHAPALSGHGEVVPFGALTFHQEAVAGLKVVTWTHNGLTYALASDLAVEGARSCVVCHGSPEERRRIEGFSPPPDRL